VKKVGCVTGGGDDAPMHVGQDEPGRWQELHAMRRTAGSVVLGLSACGYPLTGEIRLLKQPATGIEVASFAAGLAMVAPGLAPQAV
jgi:hypothetical protein